MRWLIPLIAFSPGCFDVDPIEVDDVDRGGVNDDAATSSPGPGSQPAPNPRKDIAACDPGQAAFERVLALHRATDQSVHELVTCGGAQVSLAGKFITTILLSNPEAFGFSDSTREQLESLLGASPPFTRDTTGAWLMGSHTLDRDLDFSVWFRDRAGQVITESPLRLESYLEGVRVASKLTHDEMMADWEAKNLYLFVWDKPGPLAYLLNDGEPLPSYIILSFSIWDFIYLYLGSPPEDIDFGPFASLGEVGMDSEVLLADRRDGISVGYSFVGEHATVADLGANRSVLFALDGLDAGLGELSLSAETADIRYAEGGLAGQLRYRISGPGVELEVHSDFGAGALYPETSWRCPE